MAEKRTVRDFPCPMCPHSTKRATDAEDHVRDAHGDPAQIYAVHVAKLGPDPLCACGCGRPRPWRGWRDGYAELIKGHKIPLTPEQSAERKAKVRATRAQHIAEGKISADGWAKGRTKENDPRVAERGRKTSAGLKALYQTQDHWTKGLTKETDARIAKTAAGIKESFASGQRVPAMKGKTKETDASVAAMAERVRATLTEKTLRDRLDAQKRRTPEELTALIEGSGKLAIVDGLASYTNENKSIITVECRSCVGRFSDIADKLYNGRCRLCDPPGSAGQLELYEWVKSLCPDAVCSTRSVISPQEIDVWVPSQRFGVEYNGLYWHGEQYREPDYHQRKTDRVTAIGGRLMHVFQDEWRDKRPIVESMIAHRLGKTPLKLSARDCEVCELDPATRRAFFDASHLDGDVPALLALGLFHPHRGLVAALSLRRPYSQAPEAVGSLEVARSASKPLLTVRGGLSKLCAAALQRAGSLGVQRLITYADKRVGAGDSYESARFVRVRETGPRFWWTDGQRRFGRLSVRADRARGMSEAAVAAERGVWKTWCCGNALLVSDGNCSR